MEKVDIQIRNANVLALILGLIAVILIIFIWSQASYLLSKKLNLIGLSLDIYGVWMLYLYSVRRFYKDSGGDWQVHEFKGKTISTHVYGTGMAMIILSAGFGCQIMSYSL